MGLCQDAGDVLSPLAPLEDHDGHQHAHDPADHQRAEECDGVAVGIFGRAGQVSQQICHGHADENGGNDRDPHGGHSLATAAHDTAGDLGNGNADVTHSHDPDHTGSQVNELGSLGEEAKEGGAAEQQNQRNGGAGKRCDAAALADTETYAVILSGTEILAESGN